MLISVDGNIVDKKNANIFIFDKAFLFGYSVEETIRTYNKKVFRLQDHLARLYVSAEIINLKPKWTFKKTYKTLIDFLALTKCNNLELKIILTKKQLFITAKKIKENPNEFYTKGIRLISFLGKRNIPRAKMLSDSFLYISKQYALNSNAYEALIVDPKQFYIRECSYANIFWVKHGEVYTTNKDILFGITRDTVIELINNEFKCNFKGIILKNLLSVDEIFITQTKSGILPVIEVDGHKISNGKVGPITKNIIKKFNNLVNIEN